MQSLQPTQNPQREASPDPSRILSISWGLAGTGALVAALDLDLFSLIEGGLNTAAAIAAREKLSLRGVEALLLGLGALGLVVRESDGVWRLSDDASTFLVANKPSFLGDMRHVFHTLNFRIWPELARSVRSGAPPQDLFDEQQADWAPVLNYLDTLGKPAALGIARILSEKLNGAGLVLDVGCGAGIYAQTIASALPSARLVAIDRVENTRIAAARAHAAGVADRIEFRAGDLRGVEWGGPYDAVLMSHLLHGYDADTIRGLLSLASASLKSGGCLIINEFVPDPDEPTRTPMQALFGLQMLLTSSGAAYVAQNYLSWLSEAGFRRASQLASPAGPSSYILAYR